MRKSLATTFVFCLVLLVPLLATTVQAQMIPIINAGFEDPVLNDNAFTSNSIPGWEGTDLAAPNNFGVFNPAPTFFPNEAPEGSNVAYIERGAVFQTLSEVLTANTMYTLEVLVGDSLIDPLPGFAVQLMAGGTVLAEATSPAPPEGDFTLVSLDYTAVE